MESRWTVLHLRLAKARGGRGRDQQPVGVDRTGRPAAAGSQANPAPTTHAKAGGEPPRGGGSAGVPRPPRKASMPFEARRNPYRTPTRVGSGQDPPGGRAILG